jgi:hypothetical protein
MSFLWKRNKPAYSFIIPFALIPMLSYSCIISGFVQEEAKKLDQTEEEAWENAQDMTETAYMRGYNKETAAAWNAAETMRVATSISNYQTQDAAQTAVRQTEAAPKPPVITGINFPSEIPGNKSTIIGLLYFQDPDGDVSHIVYTVVRATDFGGGVDNDPNLDSGSWTDGAIKMYIWCEGEQTVTLEAQLFDEAGNSSNPMRFTFTCK